MSWAAILTLAAGAYLFKALGLTVGGRIHRRPGWVRYLDLLPAALLSGLIIVQTLGRGRHLVVDARLVGVAAGGALVVWRRLPFLVVIVVAAAVTATVRALA